jgi:hypothetical protein
VARDLAPAWGVSATVDPFASLDDVPIGYWPLILSRGALGRQAGVHLDESGQPYAQVQLGERWSLHDGADKGDLAVLSFVVGGVLAASGLAIYFISAPASDSERRSAALTAQPFVAPGRGGATLRARF